MLSANVQAALRNISEQFSDNINDAYKSDPARNESQSELEYSHVDKEEADATREDVEKNASAIAMDMDILQTAKKQGQDVGEDQFKAFDRLGEDTYLLDMIDDVTDSDEYDDSDDDDDDDDSDDYDDDEEEDSDDECDSDQEASMEESRMDTVAQNAAVPASQLASFAASGPAGNVAAQNAGQHLSLATRTTDGGVADVEDSSDDDDDSDSDSDSDSDWDSDDDDSDESTLGDYDDLMTDMAAKGFLPTNTSASIAKLVSDYEDNQEADYALEEAQWR